MNFFFRPKGIALIGASATPFKGGNSILKNLITGFDGGIYPVNPKYETIEEVRCYPTVADVPDPVDLAIVFVPAPHVPGVVRACADRGIKGVMIESGGFSETGEGGAALQGELLEIRKETGIRLWGPNCMGLVDAVKRYVFSFVSPMIWQEGLTPGDVSLVVQSGMLSGAFLMDLMTHGVMGISKVCSIGNKMDVDECDLLEYLVDDPDTGAIGLYLEAIPDGRRFTDICRRSKKPIVILKGGRSEIGAKAAMSHTASLAGDGAVIRGAMAQSGVTEANDFKQMMDICRALAAFPDTAPKKDARVAVLTYTGGAGIVSVDFMDGLGLAPALLSEESRAKLKTVFPEWMPISNPVDLWPAVERNGAEKTYGVALEAVCSDPGVDAVLIHAFAGGFALKPDLAGMAETAKGAGKPVFIWLLGTIDAAREFHQEAQELGMVVYREIYRAVECMGALFNRPVPKAVPKATEMPAAGALPLDDAQQKLLFESSGVLAGVLDEHLSKKLLSAAGIPVVEERVAKTPESAEKAASELGLPVVMKGLLPGEVHKTEKNLVRLDIRTSEDVRRTFEELTREMSDRGEILVQPHIKGDLELIAGLVRDPQFGTCVMCGFGGILAEVIADVAFAMAPLSHEEALALIGRLKAQKLLDGFRGTSPVDRNALAQALVQLGDLGAAYENIEQVDINPLIIRNGSPIAVDASVILKEKP